MKWLEAIVAESKRTDFSSLIYFMRWYEAMNRLGFCRRGKDA